MIDSLIIGAGGFVGAYLIEELGCDSVLATKLPHEDGRLGCAVINLDLLESGTKALCATLREYRPSQIFHLAAQSSVTQSWKDPVGTLDCNSKGAIVLLEAVRAIEDYHPRILLVGSSEEYGIPTNKDGLLCEDCLPQPMNPYAVSKLTQSLLGVLYAKSYGLDVVVARPFPHIGVGQSPLFVVADFCLQVAEMELKLRPPILQVGNLDAYRDFTDVRDVVHAYALLIEHGQTGEIYNVGSGRPLSIRGILAEILRQARVPISVQIDPEKLRPIDVPYCFADTTKIHSHTGWTPVYPITETITAMLDSARNSFGI